MKEHKPIDAEVEQDTKLAGMVTKEWLQDKGFVERSPTEWAYEINGHEVVYKLDINGRYTYDHTKPIEKQG